MNHHTFTGEKLAGESQASNFDKGKQIFFNFDHLDLEDWCKC